MNYISTRGNFEAVSSARAIKLGMVPTGGLFVPEFLPVLSMNDLANMVNCSYQEVAEKVLGLYLTDYSAEEIRECIDRAYNGQNFDTPEIAPLFQLNNHTYFLELWHGPTAAFKDMALQIMPPLLSKAVKKVQSDKEIVILVATSGDTGKAALEGYKNVPGIRIIVFYPYGGVSKVQELQMTTTDGNNTYVVAVKGNFDDCQNAVKEIFGDPDYNHFLNEHGIELSSANSINWGRLVPQIIYYIWSYLSLVRQGQINMGDKINIVVPTGNFGNILAGYYAYRMGLPVNKFICASNENKVLTDFFRTGEYDRNREFIKTNSPSMDILISSNLERFLFEVNGHNSELINKWFRELNATGVFNIDAETRARIDAILAAGFATEEETLATIREVFEKKHYTVDTHTAVALKVYWDYVKSTKDHTPTVIASTANPFKFNAAVLEAIKGPEAIAGKDEMAILQELREVSGMEIHPGLRDLDKKPVRHNRVAAKEELVQEINNILGV
ncbi:threonine synthase [Thermincola potens]|uniref:Threonine synthase n=1 Tax=Thermincola potens (strain JR) TaxID=635013 RepID=D5XDF2_THEPJ|nr:threonine synthase [Thermincola potens]ADG81800.1 threonine synthase [Thermincola potens JR]